MTATLFPAALMLASAMIHAVIGVILKRSDDKLILRALIGGAAILIVLPLAFIVPLPARAAWPYLALGAALHFIYQLSQIAAFHRGDMSLVYPVMRGIAPALAALFAYLILSEPLSGIEAIGLMIAVIALIGFGWPAKTRAPHWGSAMGFALLCGMMIALYSVIDAGGMRISREAAGQVWSYMVWFFLLDGIGMLVLCGFLRRGRLARDMKAQMGWGVIAGILSLLTFGMALYAFSIAPIAQMSAMRETSVVFGAILAALLLGEPFGGRRIALACLLASGLVLMQIA